MPLPVTRIGGQPPAPRPFQVTMLTPAQRVLRRGARLITLTPAMRPPAERRPVIIRPRAGMGRLNRASPATPIPDRPKVTTVASLATPIPATRSHGIMATCTQTRMAISTDTRRPPAHKRTTTVIGAAPVSRLRKILTLPPRLPRPTNLLPKHPGSIGNIRRKMWGNSVTITTPAPVEDGDDDSNRPELNAP